MTLWPRLASSMGREPTYSADDDDDRVALSLAIAEILAGTADSETPTNLLKWQPAAAYSTRRAVTHHVTETTGLGPRGNLGGHEDDVLQKGGNNLETLFL